MGQLLLEAYLRSLQVYKHRFLTGTYIHSVAMPTASGELGRFNTLDHVGEKTGKRRAEYGSKKWGYSLPIDMIREGRKEKFRSKKVKEVRQ